MKQDMLNDDDLDVVMSNLSNVGEVCKVNAFITTHGDCAEEDSAVEELRRKIHEDFDGTVLRDEIIPDPPVRGRYGYAYIPLKDDAVPQRRKLYFQHGERKEAMSTLVSEWAERKFIERPTGPVE